MIVAGRSTSSFSLIRVFRSRRWESTFVFVESTRAAPGADVAERLQHLRHAGVEVGEVCGGDARRRRQVGHDPVEERRHGVRPDVAAACTSSRIVASREIRVRDRLLVAEVGARGGVDGLPPGHGAAEHGPVEVGGVVEADRPRRGSAPPARTSADPALGADRPALRLDHELAHRAEPVRQRGERVVGDARAGPRPGRRCAGTARRPPAATGTSWPTPCADGSSLGHGDALAAGQLGLQVLHPAERRSAARAACSR